MFGQMEGAVNPYGTSATPTPTPTPTGTPKFVVGDRVITANTTNPVNVRSTPYGTIIGTQPVGVLGTVIEGPEVANNDTWYNINYDNAPDGWSFEGYLEKVAATPTPTPTPGPIACHLYTPTSAIPTGYGVPWDVFSANELLIRATCQNATDATLDFGRGVSTQYIYNTVYHYHAGLSGWMSMTLTSTESLISNAWYPKTATVSLSGLDLQNTTHYALGYLCTWTGSAWKCGCRDSACTQSYWQIQQFKR